MKITKHASGFLTIWVLKLTQRGRKGTIERESSWAKKGGLTNTVSQRIQAN